MAHWVPGNQAKSSPKCCKQGGASIVALCCLDMLAMWLAYCCSQVSQAVQPIAIFELYLSILQYGNWQQSDL